MKWFELECISSDKVSYILIFYIALFSGICYERTSLDELLLGLKEIEGKPKVNYVMVFEHPWLHEFLKQLSEFADLVLFTAGLEGLHLLVTLHLSQVSVVLHHSYIYWIVIPVGYARPLVNRINAINYFSHRLYWPSIISTYVFATINIISFQGPLKFSCYLLGSYNKELILPYVQFN